jgi:hypothetical protein
MAQAPSRQRKDDARRPSRALAHATLNPPPIETKVAAITPYLEDTASSTVYLEAVSQQTA